MSNTGQVVHFSIPVSNLEKGSRFYGALFGWKFLPMTPTYWLMESGLGSLSLEKEKISGTMPILYFSVPSIDESLKLAVSLGATVSLEKTDAGDGKSFFATLKDPNGNVIGIWSKS
jgi:predicted enzyme related to lactoylglutathione lyase